MKRAVPFLMILLVGGLLYGHTLHAPFYLDDAGAIYDNKLVKDLPQAFAEVLAKRGLATLTFALNYRVSELNVAGYHLFNIAVHISASCVVLLLLRRVFPQRALMQLFGALIFVAHPLQTQGVTYLVQRMTSLSALLFLLAVYLFVLARECLAEGGDMRSRRHLVCYCGALLAGGAAILAKENAVVLPLALLLFSRLFLQSEPSPWRPLLNYVAPFTIFPMLAVCAYLIVPLLTGPEFDTMGYSRHLRSMEGNTPLNYLATQCSVLWIYIRMIFLPYGQALDHAYPISRELLTLKSIIGGSGLIGLMILSWRLRHRQPAIAAGILWFFLTLAVESSVIPLDPLFEHRLYLPMLGVAMLVPALLALLPWQSWQAGVLVMIILALSLLTWQRNTLWNDPIVFYEDNLRISPDNERVYFNLGQEYLKVGQFNQGELMVRESISLNPARHYGYLSLKELYVAQDRLDEAIGMLQYGLDHVDQKHKGPLYNDLAFIYGKKGDFAMAIEMLQLSIAADPKVPAAYFNLAQMLMFAGSQNQVEENLLKALELDPLYADARLMLDNMRQEKPWSGSPALRGHK